MDANERELADEKLCWLTQHTAFGRIGRRVVRGSATAAFPARNDGNKVFQQPITAHQCPSVVKFDP